MKRKLLALLVSSLCLPYFLSDAKAQSDDELPKFEVGAHFTSITKPSFGAGETEPGFGARFTFNFNRVVALEAVGNFFPHVCRSCGPNLGDNSGNIAQGFVGVKAGKRFEQWGIFAKARPGVVSFSQGDRSFINTGSGSSFPFEFQRNRLTNFAVDLGGILEFYPTKRLVTRFEAGDTLIHYRERRINFLGFDSTGSILIPFTVPSETRHNFQFTAGVGWRF